MTHHSISALGSPVCLRVGGNDVSREEGRMGEEGRKDRGGGPSYCQTCGD